jgi:CheY-like chemotaxis protein
MPEHVILLVEDNDTQREDMAFILRREGYTVVPVADTREGLSLVRGGLAPDLVLLDMMMSTPLADGWHFLKARRRDDALSRVPVMVVTGLPLASEEWVASLGSFCLLRKPVDVQRLLESVRRCLGECQG